jgi:hypothetical protein
VATYTNEVFAREYFANFLPDSHFTEASCVRDELPKTCDSFLFNLSNLPEGSYKAELSVNYRNIIKGASAELEVPSGRLSGEKQTGGNAVLEQALVADGDNTKILPFLSFANGQIAFGYSPIQMTAPIPRLMTHDATMVGKMYWASRIGGRPTQYSEFPYVGQRDTPFGPAKIYSSGGYVIALANSNGTYLPLLGQTGQQGYAVLSDIVTAQGIIKVKTNITTTPGAVLPTGNSIYILTTDAESSVFTNTFLLDGAPSQRFREVFNNGFAKSFYVI